MSIRPHFTDPKLSKRWDDAQVVIDDCDRQLRYCFLFIGVMLIMSMMLPALAGLAQMFQPEPFIGPQLQAVEVFVGPPALVPAGYIGPAHALVIK